ncbi:hypothetical protein, partial [Micromonospora sp. NPDC049274]|uniref:hypothetical protein n=1 Tax=Micromonospora sp. NPDC049274 TaxID=3154829 RepID=UPI0034465EB4
ASKTPAHKDPATLIGLYLEKIYENAVSEIAKSGYKEEEVRWCLTVPAIWDDFQKQRMRQAAVDAGMPDDPKRLVLAIEPEAAAHYARLSGVRTVGATSGRRANLLSPGTRFMLVDCGGGTVDITAYRTSSNGKLTEIGNDHGGPFGSEYINRHFVSEILCRKLGSTEFVADLKKDHPRAFFDMLDAWERAKTGFGESFTDVYIHLPASVDRVLPEDVRTQLAHDQDGITDAIVIREEEVESCFDAVIPGLLTLIGKQLDEMQSTGATRKFPELIVLVGGFGKSSYLQRKIAERFRDRAEVLVPGEPEAAVLLGAAHFAYDPQTRARRTKSTYGIECVEQFNASHPKDKLVDIDGEPYCDDIFAKFVLAGDIVEIGYEKSKIFFPTTDSQSALQINVCKASTRHALYTTDAGVAHVGKVSVDLKAVRHLPKHEKSVRVTMHFGGTQIRVSAEVVKSGQRVEASIDFEPN